MGGPPKRKSIKTQLCKLRVIPGFSIDVAEWRSASFVDWTAWHSQKGRPVAPVEYQVILEPGGGGQFSEFEPTRVHTRKNSSGLFLVHKLTCGKRESVS